MIDGPAIEVRHLTKDFRVGLRGVKLRAVDDVSLSIPRGQVFGLLGPNGCGKSTTLKVVLGLLPATAGEVTILGQPSATASARARTGFLPEAPYFHKFLTGRELVRYCAHLSGVPAGRVEAAVDEAVALVDLREASGRLVGTYSKGMLQRIGLAQALIQDPGLVVLDEPTAGVDPAGSHQIRDLILDLKKRGKTVLLTSHLLEQVQEICDRVGIMARGEMIREGSLDDLVRVKNQTEFVIENASPELAAQIQNLVAQSPARLVATRQPERSLESVFLELTAGDR